MVGGNGLAAMLVKGMGPKADAEDPKAGLKAAAEELLKAIEAKDSSAIADAFGSLFSQMESAEPEAEPAPEEV